MLVTLSAAAVSVSRLQINAEIKTPLSLAETRESIVELRLQSNSNFNSSPKSNFPPEAASLRALLLLFLSPYCKLGMSVLSLLLAEAASLYNVKAEISFPMDCSPLSPKSNAGHV